MLVAEQPQRILTVSQLTALVRARLEEGFPDLWIEGEISNLRCPSSGHFYLTLKDEHSQLRAVLFRSSAQRIRFALEEGLCVIVRGRLTVYEPRGEYQIILDYVEPKGIGALQLALEQLKEKLTKEGLFDASRKRPLPFLPRRVGLVTSLSGAAIRDMLVVLQRRCPSLDVLICPVPVQGEGAAPLIAEAIKTLSESGLVDVMIVGRGGGSLEDLWSFNEEVVVRAIAGSAVPVVSAVGHEIDYTLADLAADYRAPTPSAAAEAVAPVLADLILALKEFRSRQVRAMQTRLSLARYRMEESGQVFARLLWSVQQQALRMDDLAGRLHRSVQDGLATLRQRLLASRHGLAMASPWTRIRSALVLIPQYVKRIEQRVLAKLVFRQQAVRSLAAALDSLSPLAILARGYGIVQKMPEGTVVRRTGDVAAGDRVSAKLVDGRLICAVEKIIPDA